MLDVLKECNQLFNAAIDREEKREMILKLDAPLYIDVTCWDCKRNCALSNTIERDGRHYCLRCAGLL